MQQTRRRLEANQIAAMRLYYEGGHRVAALARHYGVSYQVAYRICLGKTHKRVQPDVQPLTDAPVTEAEPQKRVPISDESLAKIAARIKDAEDKRQATKRRWRKRR